MVVSSVSLVYIYSNDKYKLFENESKNVVILSPSMYWFKVCEIPTKNIAKAKNIARHIMSDRADGLDDMVLNRVDGGYEVFAYNEKSVLQRLKYLGISEYVLYFAAQLNFDIDSLNGKVAIDNENILCVVSNRVLEFPNTESNLPALVDNYHTMLDVVKPAIKFEQQTSNVKYVLLTASIFLFGIMLLYSFLRYESSKKLEQQISLLSKNKSFYEIKSLIRKYERIDKESIRMKREFKKILDEKDLKSIELSNGKFKVEK